MTDTILVTRFSGEQNRCLPLEPIPYSAPIVCEAAGAPGTFNFNGPTFSFEGINYNNTPLGENAVWIDLGNPNDPVIPLPLNETSIISASKPIYVYLLHLYLTSRSGVAPGEYHITAYTQSSFSELEDWLYGAISFGALEPQSKIVAHSVACVNNVTEGNFIVVSPPLSSIPSFEFEKVNVSLVTDTTYQVTGLDPAQTYLFAADAVDGAGNWSELSNIELPR
ncbi:MAG: fibronectin type III domain-containing protein [bacterium]